VPAAVDFVEVDERGVGLLDPAARELRQRVQSRRKASES
jgi:hypothetical protein